MPNEKKNLNTPCKPETISTTSSYTMRVAALSGRRSRLMEENTGMQNNKTLAQVHCIRQPWSSWSSSKMRCYLVTLLITTKPKKSQ